MTNQLNYDRIKTAMEYIAANFENQPKVEDIAKHINISEFHFQRIFKDWSGISPKKFLQYITLQELKKHISESSNITELSEKVGLSTQSRVYDLFVNFESVTPQEFKSRGLGINIVYGIHETPFGKCLIASTSRGVCALEFFDQDLKSVIKSFKLKWKNASITEDKEATSEFINQIFYSSSNNLKALLYGTPFQMQVWEALLKIPYGDIVSYNDIAQEIHKPKASRAVANAIGSNNIAFLIPCHRVIRKIGSLGGYKWGEGRKLALLGYEQVQQQA